MRVTSSRPMASTIDCAMVVLPDPDPPARPMTSGPAVGHEPRGVVMGSTLVRNPPAPGPKAREEARTRRLQAVLGVPSRWSLGATRQ